ncbi:hypothetical protein [Nocardia terpenica]|uniref:Uncharacterized protein n=1 Tax=Nocardia terpenica TaxID=455432 RepID=A0A161WQC3_9NOCA|nr:hypothetical protein [Nocardia terpenica]KZM75505.1 hypothetical protein AWN90_19185 [Nocardia terpenica]NQE85975.1 hypothetical protein [Nocardia terpenica]
MTYDSPWNMPLRIAVTVLIGVWRCWQMTHRKPTAESLAITVAILAACVAGCLETLSAAQARSVTGRPYITASLQTWTLMIMLVALCVYYAAGHATPAARNLIYTVAGIGAVSAVATLVSGVTVTPGRALWDFEHTDTLTWYFTSALFFPVATFAAGLLAARAARRATGALRVALGLATTGLWILALNGLVMPFGFWSGHRAASIGIGPQDALAEPLKAIVFVGYIVGGVVVVLSWAAVAVAHRTRQLRATWIATLDARAMRRLRDDLGTIGPYLTFPRAGWTPLLLRPHTARMTARIECRDRLVTFSPRLADELDPAAYQDPDSVAAALVRLRRAGALYQPDSQVAAAPILIIPGADGRDQLIPLARSYARQSRPDRYARNARRSAHGDHHRWRYRRIGPRGRLRPAG